MLVCGVCLVVLSINVAYLRGDNIYFGRVPTEMVSGIRMTGSQQLLVRFASLDLVSPHMWTCAQSWRQNPHQDTDEYRLSKHAVSVTQLMD